MNEYPFCHKVKHPITRKETYRAGLIYLTNQANPQDKDMTYPAFGISGFRYSVVYTGQKCIVYCETHNVYPELSKNIKEQNYTTLATTYPEPFHNTEHVSLHPSPDSKQIESNLRQKFKTFLYNRKKGNITDKKIWAIRYHIASGRPIKHIATDFHLNRRNINDIINYYLVPLNEVTEEWYTWYHTKRSEEDVKFDKKQKFKRLKKRRANAEEIEYILTKTLEGWKPVKIYNVLLQERPTSLVNREWVDNISKGTVRVIKDEVDEETYKRIGDLKRQVTVMNSKTYITA